ncbi:MAG: SGNH/GDSL hydrolase family protein [Candidatus Aminicenantaceae bacterium]
MRIIIRTFPRKTTWLLILLLFFPFCSSSPQGFIVLCAGDSITAADYPRFLQRRFDQDGILVKVLNYGRSGDTSGEYLAFLKKNTQILSKEHPDFILIQLGTNDLREDQDNTSATQFSANMKDIINIFSGFKTRSGKTPQSLIATIPSIPENSPSPFTEKSHRRVRDEINPIIRQIADDQGLVLVDNYTLLLDQSHLLPEVHPSREGYRQIALNWYNSLKPLIK